MYRTVQVNAVLRSLTKSVQGTGPAPLVAAWSSQFQYSRFMLAVDNLLWNDQRSSVSFPSNQVQAKKKANESHSFVKDGNTFSVSTGQMENSKISERCFPSQRERIDLAARQQGFQAIGRDLDKSVIVERLKRDASPRSNSFSHVKLVECLSIFVAPLVIIKEQIWILLFGRIDRPLLQFGSLLNLLISTSCYSSCCCYYFLIQSANAGAGFPLVLPHIRHVLQGLEWTFRKGKSQHHGRHLP